MSFRDTGPQDAELDLLFRAVGRADLSGVHLLDLSSEPNVVKALLDQSLPIGRYTGVAFSSESSERLQTNVSDPRFEFHPLDARNAWLNPEGRPLESFDLLPVGPLRFDLICAFSTFTHLPPDDFVALLRLLRRHTGQGGKLLFSLLIIDAEHPPPFEEELRARLNSDVPEVRVQTAALIEEALQRTTALGHDARFVDWDPDEPLARAQYTEDYARELVEGTGWEVEAIHPPERHLDHHMVCHAI